MATQDATEKTVLGEKKISPKSTTTARSVRTSPADSDPRGGARSDAAFASEKTREVKEGRAGEPIME